MNQLLTPQDRRKIEQKARELLWASYGDVYDLQPPIRLSKILPAIGLKLKFGKFEDPTVSGYFDRSDKVIYVSETEPYHRQVFTIGHELGHFLLHEDRESDIFFRLSSIQLDQAGDNPAHQAEEQAASWFATCLLLPKELLLLYWNVEKNIDRLAHIFEVSQSILEWRLKDLRDHRTSENSSASLAGEGPSLSKED